MKGRPSRSSVAPGHSPTKNMRASTDPSLGTMLLTLRLLQIHQGIESLLLRHGPVKKRENLIHSHLLESLHWRPLALHEVPPYHLSQCHEQHQSLRYIERQLPVVEELDVQLPF